MTWLALVVIIRHAQSASVGQTDGKKSLLRLYDNLYLPQLSNQDIGRSATTCQEFFGFELPSAHTAQTSLKYLKTVFMIINCQPVCCVNVNIQLSYRQIALFLVQHLYCILFFIVIIIIIIVFMFVYCLLLFHCCCHSYYHNMVNKDYHFCVRQYFGQFNNLYSPQHTGMVATMK